MHKKQYIELVMMCIISLDVDIYAMTRGIG